MLVSGWHPAHIDWTCSLPGPSGRSTGLPPRPWAGGCACMRTTMAAPATSVRSTDVRVFVLVGIEGLLERGVGDARAGEAPHCTVQSGRLTAAVRAAHATNGRR